MLNAPVGHPADIFIWIVCILIGFATALVVLDNMPKKKKETE